MYNQQSLIFYHACELFNNLQILNVFDLIYLKTFVIMHKAFMYSLPSSLQTNFEGDMVRGIVQFSMSNLIEQLSISLECFSEAFNSLQFKIVLSQNSLKLKL